MSACASSPITRVAARVGPVLAERSADLLVALGAVVDPRKARGRRHRLVTVLAISVAAVLAGARSYVAIAEWVHDLPVSARLRLGISGRAPSETTIRRVLQTVDLEALDRALSAWLTARLPEPVEPVPVRSVPAVRAQPNERPPPRLIAVDGKSIRGARDQTGRAPHLLAAFDHIHGVVLGQSMVDGKSNEITAFAPLLDRIDVTGALVTADALHTQRGHAAYLHERGGHYLLIVKPNQPRLHSQLVGLPWQQIPIVNEDRDRGHGRIEHRRVKLTAVGTGLGFPHAQLAIQIQRRRRPLRATAWTEETIYAVTSMNWRLARPDVIAGALRGHWRIEALHWIRDVTFGEDLSQTRTGNGPAVMATLRNFAVSRHRLASATNIAQACRHTSRHPNRALDLLT